MKSRFPKVGRTIDSPLGRAKVIQVSVLRETARLLLEDGTIAELTLDELDGKVEVEPAGLSSAVSSALQASLGEGASDAQAGPGSPSESQRGVTAERRAQRSGGRRTSKRMGRSKSQPAGDGDEGAAETARSSTDDREGEPERRWPGSRSRSRRGGRPAAPPQPRSDAPDRSRGGAGSSDQDADGAESGLARGGARKRRRRSRRPRTRNSRRPTGEQ